MKNAKNHQTALRRTAGGIIVRTAASAVLLAFLLFPVASSASDHEHDRVGDSRRHESKIYGTVDQLPPDRIGVWIVGGREIVVTRDTRIKQKHGLPEPGAYVKVEGNVQGKIFTAYEIEVKRSGHR